MLKKFNKCNPFSRIEIHNQIPQLIYELSTFGGPNKIGYSFSLKNAEIQTTSLKPTSHLKHVFANFCHSQDL
jgi:hypothetical protein